METVGCKLGLARFAHGGRHISEIQVSFSPVARPWPWTQGAQPAARTAPESGPCLVPMLRLQALPGRLDGIHSQAALALPASCGLSRVLAKPPSPGPGLFPGVRHSLCTVQAPLTSRCFGPDLPEDRPLCAARQGPTRTPHSAGTPPSTRHPLLSFLQTGASQEGGALWSLLRPLPPRHPAHGPTSPAREGRWSQG